MVSFRGFECTQMNQSLLQDLTRLESGNETSFNEPFNLHATIADAVRVYSAEATRRNIAFDFSTKDCPRMVLGDSKKIRTVVANITANARALPVCDKPWVSA